MGTNTYCLLFSQLSDRQVLVLPSDIVKVQQSLKQAQVNISAAGCKQRANCAAVC